MSAPPSPVIAGVILAAGRARRMERPKQLLPFRGTTLVSHALGEALAALAPVVVVVGAYSEEVRSAIASQSGLPPVHVVTNLNWESGMASSIAAGIDYLSALMPVDAVLLMAGDQPFVTSAHLQGMCSAFINPATERPDVVAASYAGTLGIPAIFGKHLFPRLLTLTGDKGARMLFQDDSLRVRPYPLPEAAVDIDTPEDAAALGVRL